MRFDEEPSIAILGAAYRELTRNSNEKVTVNALMAAVQSKGISRQEVKEFLEKQKRGEERSRKYFDGP